MKTHSTNYFNVFIEVAENSKAVCGVKPPHKDKKSIAEMQYELITESPYRYTSDDILFQVFADRNDLAKTDCQEVREHFFSKGQPCLRTSPLTKTYGFGIHNDLEGRVAIFGMDTIEYQHFLADEKIIKVKAMKSSK